MMLWIEEIREKEISWKGHIEISGTPEHWLERDFLGQIDRHGTRRTWHRDLGLGRTARDTDESVER